MQINTSWSVEGKMGNIIHPHRRDNVKPEQTLATIRAAGIFKARRNETNVRKSKTSEQIEEIVKWKFRRKSDVFGYLPMGRLASIDESQEQNADSSEKDVLKFVRSVNISDKLAIKDTSVAWNALRELASRERSASLQETGRFKVITDSLRFARRTTTLAKKPKVVSEEICYNGSLTTEWETRCNLCHTASSMESPLNPCRICPRVYHTDCLEKRGHLSLDAARDTLRLSRTDIGWSCFDCENLFDLLSDNEKIDIMETFDLMDTNQDSFINKEEYLTYQRGHYRKLLGMEMPGYRVTSEEQTFEDMDRNNNDFVDWWEFVIPMSVRKLTERRKRALMSLLTKQEIHKLREFFKEYDEEGEGEISKSSSREVFRNWYLSLIHRREEDIPVWDWIGTDWVKTDYNSQIVCKEFNTVKWKDFVLNHALYILAARPNTGSMRPYVPKLNSCYSEVEDEEDDNKSY